MNRYRYRFHSVIACAFAACALVFGAVVLPVYQFAVATCRAVKNFALDGFKLAANQGEGLGRPQVRMVQAKAFVARLIKRDRPVITSTWRHCPST